MNQQVTSTAAAVNPSPKPSKAVELLDRVEDILGPCPKRGAQLRALKATLAQLREAINDAGRRT